MSKLIYWLLGAVTFIFVATSTIWKQAVSLSLCGILGFNSVTCHSWFLDSRVNAAVPKSGVEIAQVDIFDNRNGGNSTPTNGNVDIFSNPQPGNTNINNNNRPIDTNINRIVKPKFSIVSQLKPIENGLYETVLNSPEGCQIVRRIRKTDKSAFYETIKYIVPNKNVCGGKSYIFTISQDARQFNIKTSLNEEFLIDVINSTTLKVNYKDVQGKKWLLEAGLDKKTSHNIYTPQKISENVKNNLVNNFVKNYKFNNKTQNETTLIKPSEKLIIAGDPINWLYCEICQLFKPLFEVFNAARGHDNNIDNFNTYGKNSLKMYHAMRISDTGKFMDAATDASINTVIDKTVGEELNRTWEKTEEATMEGTGCASNDACIKSATADAADEVKKSADSFGEPHLRTFDGFRYDHQAMGEFILTKSTDNSFELQVRESAVPGRSDVSVNSAAAMKIGSDRIAFYAKDFPDSNTSTPVRINSKPTVVQGTLTLPGGGRISKNGGTYIVQWPTGEQVAIGVSQFATAPLLNVSPSISQNRQGQMMGLLGNFNGNPNDDLRTRSGEIIKPQSSINEVKQITQNFNIAKWIPIPLNQVESVYLNELHKKFGDSWRVSQAESLFDYAPGKNTESFTNRAFPNGFQILRMLLPQQVQMAEKACQEAGVGADRLEGCMFDVGVTGNADFAKLAVNALTNVVKDKVEQEIRNRIPVNIPGVRLR